MRGDTARAPAWLWLLAVLLLVNLVVLAGLLLRSPAERLAAEPEAPAVLPSSDTSPVSATPVARGRPDSAAAAVTPPSETGPATKDIAALTSRPDRDLPGASAQLPDPATPAVVPAPASPPETRSPTNAAANLPDIDQLRADGLLPLGELRLDIHVYSDVPADRFVFINMVKHREGSTTADGLAVDTITPDGVILDYRGRRFLLPRQ